jgi:hypothetical protein
MSLFKRLREKLTSKPTAKAAEQALIVHFEYGLPDLEPLYEQSRRLDEALRAAGVGEYDGHEIALSLADGFYYMYGPNADLLLEVADPVFRSTAWFRRAKITRRYGPVEGDVRRVVTEFAA